RDRPRRALHVRAGHRARRPAPLARRQAEGEQLGAMALAPTAALLSAALLAGTPGAPRGRGRGGAVEAAPATPAEEFERGRTAFARGEYGRALQLLRPLVYPEVRLETEGEVVQAHRMLGVASLFENDPDSARREFRKLLELRPDYRFDPLLDPKL